MTQDQQNTLDAFARIGKDIKDLKKPVDVRRFGIATQVETALAVGTNTNALLSAIDSGEPLSFPKGRTSVDGTFTITGPAFITAQTNAQLRQMSDINCIVINNNGSVQGPLRIENLWFMAGANMNSATALTIENKDSAVNARLANLIFSRESTAWEWKRGIYIENPHECDLRDIRILGNNTSKLVGVEFGSTKAAVSTTLDNVKVYDAETAFKIRSSTRQGIEGLKFRGCDGVGVNYGIDAQNTYPSLPAYMPPGLQILQSHFNAYTTGVKVVGYCQVDVSETIFYSCATGSYSAGVTLKDVASANLMFNKFYVVSTGRMYGIVANEGNNTYLKANFNHFELHPAGGESGIWYGPNTIKSQALYNTVVGVPTGFDVFNEGSNNTVTGNVRY